MLPGERNNVVAIKPTVGLTPRYLVVPVSEHQDTVGPMARTVRDAALLLQAISGPDPRDRYTLKSPFGANIPDYTAACKPSGLLGKRIGIARNVIKASVNQATAVYVMKAFEQAVALMEGSGATIVENANFTDYEEWKKRKFNPVTRADFSRNLPQYLSRLEYNSTGIRCVEDLRAFTQRFPAEAYPRVNTAVWDNIRDVGMDNTSPRFMEVYKQNLRFGGEGGILGALKRFQLDAVVLPSSIASSIPALVGTPIVTVPLGAAPAETEVVTEAAGDAVEVAPGLPFGISFLGPKWSEECLIEIAYAFEQKTLVRKTLTRHLQPHTDLEDTHLQPRHNLDM